MLYVVPVFVVSEDSRLLCNKSSFPGDKCVIILYIVILALIYVESYQNNALQCMHFIIAMIEVVCFISVNEIGALFDLYCYIAPYLYMYMLLASC